MSAACSAGATCTGTLTDATPPFVRAPITRRWRTVGDTDDNRRWKA
jgi:hypothetical protein